MRALLIMLAACGGTDGGTFLDGAFSSPNVPCGEFNRSTYLCVDPRKIVTVDLEGIDWAIEPLFMSGPSFRSCFGANGGVGGGGGEQSGNTEWDVTAATFGGQEGVAVELNPFQAGQCQWVRGF